MNKQEFEQLWQYAEGAEFGRRLSEEYPAWRRAQRRTAGVMASLVVAVAVTIPLLTLTHTPKDFEQVYCNRTGTSEAQWADLAATLLIES